MSLPRAVKQLLNIFSELVSFGITPAGVSTPLACTGYEGYRNVLHFYMITPFLLVALVVLVALCTMLIKRRFTREALIELALPPILRILFLLYPLATNTAFDAFPCYEFADGSRWLKADVAIDCDSATYKHDVVLTAWAAVVIYPVGLVVLNASLLFCARKAIVSKRETTLSKAIEFLHKEYEPHIFWWELVEMIRRFVLIGIMIVVYNGSMLQLTIGTLCASILLFFQVQAAPFVDDADDYLAAASSFSLLVLFLCVPSAPLIPLSLRSRQLSRAPSAPLTHRVTVPVTAARLHRLQVFLAL